MNLDAGDPERLHISTIGYGQSPIERAPWDHLCLFNRAGFSALNLREGEAYIRLDYRSDERIIGSLVGVQIGTSFVSGHHANFGGIDMTRTPEQVHHLPDMMKAFWRGLASLGVRDVKILCKPEVYSANEPFLYFALMGSGLSVADCELDAYLDLGALNSQNEYVNGLKSSARRVLKHGLAVDFRFRQAETTEDWTVGYGVLQQNRENKGRSLSLSRDYVMRLRDAFPGEIRMYLLEESGHAVAAALLYRITASCGRVMYWGDAGHAFAHSPMNVLVYHLIGLTIRERWEILDLGTSKFDVVTRTPGTLAFKQNVGAKIGLRMVLTGQLGKTA